jgi:hypothetical protein
MTAYPAKEGGEKGKHAARPPAGALPGGGLQQYFDFPKIPRRKK